MFVELSEFLVLTRGGAVGAEVFILFVRSSSCLDFLFRGVIGVNVFIVMFFIGLYCASLVLRCESVRGAVGAYVLVSLCARYVLHGFREVALLSLFIAWLLGVVSSCSWCQSVHLFVV